jgi:hypothetical protein
MAALAASADVESEQEITGYSGDIAPNTDPLKACNHDHPPCAYYCNAKYCAHGKGRVVFFGGEHAEGREWYYNGDFVHGRMEGFGKFTTDHFIYKGQFKANQFDGHGTVQCEYETEGWYEGEFAGGRLIGELRIHGKAQTLTWFKPGDYVDRLYGPCLPPR